MPKSIKIYRFDGLLNLSLWGWYFYLKEVAMILKILVGLILGGSAGFGLSYLTRSIGST
jgi:hypothetical protein